LKIAQMLSIDKNILPKAYNEQFSLAQYSAPPLSYPLVVRTFRREFGKEPTALFDTFEPQAAHGASIGQVHRATLGGHRYAVKVQYPGVADSLKSDLRVVKPIALQIIGLRENEVDDYFREIEERLLEETNYVLERERATALAEASRHLPHVRFPRYYPELSCGRILTMDWVDGVPLDRFADSNPSQADRDRIGQALWDLYAHQVHTLRLFHADPHPGNFLVHDGNLWVLDFGCTKAIAPDFYEKQFRFLDPALIDDPQAMEEALEALEIILPTDSPEHRRQLIPICAQSLAALAKPFHTEIFDFGDPAFMEAIWTMGERNRNNPFLRATRGRRGSAHSVYVNRTFFGLYSLLSRLGARVTTHRGAPVHPPLEAVA
jgi:predicted unusual protein kinase regulating ubiquinone biosynthesis (AarF/ABC1/UbiB family)